MEFKDVCVAMREICRHQTECEECVIHGFCEHIPVSWHTSEIEAVERYVKRHKDPITIGQYLEERGVISRNDDNYKIVNKLYETKAPLEWLK